MVLQPIKDVLLPKAAQVRPDRFAAAFLAISARRSDVMFAARAGPPFLHMADAAGSTPRSSGVGSRSLARGDTDHTFCPLVQVAQALGGLSHFGCYRTP